MKYLIIILFFLHSLNAASQTVNYNIRGTVKDVKHAKFAYISTLSQQVPISSDKLFTKKPIVNGEFEFSGSFDLEGKHYQYACIFIDERGNISKEELASKFKQLIWVTGGNENLRKIVLEDLGLEIEEKDQMINSKIISGGRFTKQADEIANAHQSGNLKFLDVIKNYPDSQMSFNTIKEITEFATPDNLDRIESRLGSLQKMFDLLSDKFKQSTQGVQLQKDIIDKSKSND